MYKNVLALAGFPTDVVIVDFETYFDNDYTLRKQDISLIEYVTDSRFEMLGLGVGVLKESGLSTRFYRSDEVKDALIRLQKEYGQNLERCTVAGHNLYFDALILREKHGIVPQYTVDTIDLARHLDARGKHSLEYLAGKYGATSPKGDTMQFIGLHVSDITEEQWAAMTEYCCTDVTITNDLLKKLLPRITRPYAELPLAAQNLQMFLVPRVIVDEALGEQLLNQMQEQIDTAIQRAKDTGLWVEVPPTITKRVCRPPILRRITKDDIAKDSTFVELLRSALPDGEDIPTKPDKNGKPIPALAKTDRACERLLSHPSPIVRALMEARKATDSWRSHIKRVRRLLAQARCKHGQLGIQLRYCGGITGRESGAGGINVQNFGARDVHPLIKQIGRMLVAPPGWLMGTGDLSQIEARVIAWLAGQTDLVEQFARGEDVYSDFAQNHIFHEETRKPRKDDPPELAKQLTIRRDFGKMGVLALGYGMGGNTTYLRCLSDKSLRPLFDNKTYDVAFCHRLVKLYRDRYTKIVSFWTELERAWKFVTKYRDQSTTICHGSGRLSFSSLRGEDTTVIQLPSGRCIFYPHSRVDVDGRLSYSTGEPKVTYYLYGGALAENITQAVARDVFMDGSLRCAEAGFPIVFRVHDQLVTLIEDDSNAQTRLAEMHRLQTTGSAWAEGLPVDVEGKLIHRYEK